jgi:hypothetical protein
VQRGERARCSLEVVVQRVVERCAGQVLLNEQTVRDLRAGGVDVVELRREAKWCEQPERVGFVEDLLVAGGDLLRAGGDAQDDALATDSGAGQVVEVVLALRERGELERRLDQMGPALQIGPCQR